MSRWDNTEMVQAGRHYHSRARHRTGLCVNRWSQGEASWLSLAPWRAELVGIQAVEEIWPLPEWTGYCPKQRGQKGKIPWHLPSSLSSLLPAPAIGVAWSREQRFLGIVVPEKPSEHGKAGQTEEQLSGGPAQCLRFVPTVPQLLSTRIVPINPVLLDTWFILTFTC